MTKWILGVAGLLQLGLGLACDDAPDPVNSAASASALHAPNTRQAACEAEPVKTCNAIAQASTVPTDSPDAPYIDAMIDACPVGGEADCNALARWTAGSGSDPLPLFKANCTAGSVASCQAASVLLAEEAPHVSRAFDYMAQHVKVGTPCGDLLADAGLSTKGLQFLGCQPGNVHQLAALVAEYRVVRRDVDAVEARLVKDTGVAPMRFVCCGWESKPHGFRGKDGEHYHLTMGSAQETDDDTRARMPDLKVTVARLIELP